MYQKKSIYIYILLPSIESLESLSFASFVRVEWSGGNWGKKGLIFYGPFPGLCHLDQRASFTEEVKAECAILVCLKNEVPIWLPVLA
jgi:hypothetical protein